MNCFVLLFIFFIQSQCFFKKPISLDLSKNKSLEMLLVHSNPKLKSIQGFGKGL